MARERIDDWMQMAKDLARAERDLQIEHWVYITFEYREDDRSRFVLHKIDIPRRMLDRWRWLVEWRRAKYVCQYPRKGVQVYHCYYDKRTGLQTGFGSLLSCVAAAKAQITKGDRQNLQSFPSRRSSVLVFLAISLLHTPPRVSMPRDSGVTSSSRTSLTSPPRTQRRREAPIARH